MIKEKTKYYTIQAKTAFGLSRQMSKKGPYSRQHKRRAWATTQRDTSYQITTQETGNSCRITAASVKTNITYTLPKVRNIKKLSGPHRKRWRKMYALLLTHERVHGRYYRDFSFDLRKKLLRMKPQRNCFTLNRKVKQLVARLSKKNSALNIRFDKRDRRNYRRMQRLVRP